MNIEIDLTGERVDVFEFLFRSEIFEEADFEVFSVNFALEIQQVNLENALGLIAADRWPITEIYDARIFRAIQGRFGKIDPVGRKLLAVCAQVCRGEPDLLSEIIAMDDGSENCVFAAQHLGCFRQIAAFHRLPDRRAAYDVAIDRDRRNSYDVEIGTRAEFFEEIEITAPIFPKRPFMADTNFAKRI